jgi:ribosomal protein S27E
METSMGKPEHPMQPLIWDKNVIRFKQNKIVRFLLDNGGHDPNQMWRMYGSDMFPIEDLEQFYQLIGYSVSGFGEMSEFRSETVAKADELAAGMRKCPPNPVENWCMVRCPVCGADNWIDGDVYRKDGTVLECHACSESTSIAKTTGDKHKVVCGLPKPE